MRSRRLFAAAAVLLLPLAGCAADEPDVSDPLPTADPTSEPATDVPSDDPTDDPSDDPSDGPPSESPSEDAGSDLVAVALTFDGLRVPVAEACNGADGAVVATTDGDVTVQAVREGGAQDMRYLSPSDELYVEDVDVETIGQSTIFTGTFEPAESEPFTVEMELGDTDRLPDC